MQGIEVHMVNCFMKLNDGLARRFPYIIKLKDYTPDILAKILIGNIRSDLINFDIEFSTYINNYIYSLIIFFSEKIKNGFKGQAGDMLNLSKSITKTIFSSFNKEWINNDNFNNEEFILNGFIDFFKNNGVDVKTLL